MTAAGLINLAETDAVTLTAIDTFNGAITLTTGGTTTVTNVTATSGAGADANDISITATAGDITVATVNNANALGDVTIVANTVAGQGILDDGAATVITGDVVTLTANDAVGETAGGGAIDTTAVSLDVSVTAAGLINLAETDAVTLTDVDTANGLITITAGGLLTATDVVSSTDNEANDISLTGVGIAVGVVTAGATVGDVTLAAGTGAITDAAADAATDVTAEVLTADATTGINLDTSATTLDVDNATSGNIDLDNSHTGSAITVLSLTNGGAGSIDLDQTGTDVTTDTLTISGAVISTGGGVVTIRTLTRGDIAVNSGITSSGGTINISSADDITLGAVTLDSDLTGSINLDVDNNITAAAQLDLGSGVLIGATIAFDGGTAGGDDTLIAQNLANTWVIGNTNNAGTLANSSIAPDASAAFTNFQNLTGNGDTDEFSFTGTGSISGAVDGQGSVDTLDYSALTAQISVVLTGGGLTDGFASTSGTSKVGSFDDINVVVGSSSLTNDDNLTSTVGLGTTATWDINGANQYSTGGDILDFSLMENLTGDNSADTFTVSVSHTGTLSGLDGNDTFNLTLTSVVSGDLLGGTGDDTFDFNDTARVIGTVVGGNLPGTPADEIDFFDSTLTVALAIVTTSASHGRTGTIENIAAGPDLITGGFSQIDNFVGSSDQIIGPDAETWWNITSTDSGTFGGSLGTITASTFNGFSILGGNKADYFIFQDTGDLGTIDGGINDPLIFNTLVGSLGGDTFDITGATSVTYTVIDGASVTHITTLSNIHNIDGTFATDADGPPPTGDTGNDIFNIDFSWGGDLIGVGGDDQFVFADGKTVGGTVDGGAGSDTVDWGAYTVSARNVVVTDLDNQGADGTEASITNGFTDIEILTGAGITGTGGDKLTNGTGITATTTVDWDISGVDSGTLDINGDVLTFNSFANLTGDAEDDNFIFSGGTLSGKVIGDAGTNTLDYSGAGATVAITLTALSATPANGFSGSAVHQSVATAFDHITVVVGSDLGDTLTGTDNAADWDIKDIGGSSDGIDDGTYDNSGTMLDFINIANLTGGAGIDTFVLDTSASLSGSIAGGADDDSITFGDGSSVGGSVDGGAGSDTLDFTDESVATSITLTAAGTSGLSGTSATNITVSFTDINVLVGNDDPLTELTGANLAATWNISDFDGVGLVSDGIDDGTYTVGTQSLKFVDFHNLTGGSSSDNFAFADSGSISGDVDGSGIADGDTVTGDANGNIFTIDSADTGTLTGKIGGTWSNVENLTGGAGADTFEFDASSSLSGNIDGAGDLDTLDWNTLGFGAPVTVTLTGLGTDGFAGTATGLPTGTFTNINTVLGDAGQSNLNSLIGQGADAEWDITSSDGGTYVSTNTLTWTNFGNLTGNSFDDEFEFDGGDLSGALDGGGGSGDLIIADDGGNAFVINGPDSGTLIGTITGGWSNIANLEGGAGVDTFTFITGGSLSGSMDGAGGTADVLTGDDDGNAFAITGAESGTLLPSIGGTWSNIENLVGGVGVDTVVFTTTGSVAGTVDGAGGSADILTGDDDGNAFAVTGADSGTLTGKTAGWLGFENLTGGAGDDSFTLTSGNLTGAIDAAAGTDTLLGNAIALTINVTGAGSGTVTSGVTVGSFSNVEVVVGSSADDSISFTDAGSLAGAVDGSGGTDTLTGDADGNAFTVTGVGIGTLVTKTSGWSNIENLIGGVGVDTVLFTTTGSVAGTVDGAGGSADILTGDDDGNAFAVTGADSGTLTGKTAGWSGFENLTGGADQDTFTFAASGSLSGTAAGAGDADTYDMNGGTVNLADGGNGSDTLNLVDVSPVTLTLTAFGSNLADEGFAGHSSANGGVTAFDNINVAIGGGSSSDTLVTEVADGTFNIRPGMDLFDVNPSLLFSGFEDLIGSAGTDTFIINEAHTGNISGGGGADTLIFNAAHTGTVDGDAGNDTFTFNIAHNGTGAISGGSGDDLFTFDSGIVSDLAGDSGNDTYTFTGGSFSGILTVFGDDIWNHAPGISFGTAIVGAEDSSLTIPNNAGGNLTIGPNDLKLPSLIGFTGHLIIGGTLTPPTLQPDGNSDLVINTDTLFVNVDLITGGDLTLLGGDITFQNELIQAGGGPGGADILMMAVGNLGAAQGEGIITTESVETLIEGGSLTMIAASAVTEATSMVVDLTPDGELMVAQGSGDAPQFGRLTASPTVLSDAYVAFLNSLGLTFVDVGDSVTQANLAGNLIGLQQLAFIDLGLFEEDLSLFGVIGQGIALALAQCEEQEGCAPNVTDAELKALIEQLEARITELERRLADPANASQRRQIEALLAGYREQLVKFVDLKQQLDEYTAQESAAEDELLDDFSEDLGGGRARDVPGQVKALGKVLEVTKGRVDWLESLKGEADARAKLSKSTGMDLTIEALDRLIEAVRQEIKFIETQIQQLLQGTQAQALPPFRAESGTYAMIQNVEAGPGLLLLGQTGISDMGRWH